ncbi:MAG: hypothetical protein M3Q97_00105, partial [Bacteroidota bacterium]|nr:hypothetical protein [Bacteroidota bacterium]
KAGHKPKHSLRKIYEGVKKTKHKVIGLGGINESRVDLTKEVGFHGIALLGAIWQSSDPVGTFIAIKKKCSKNSEELSV